MSSKIKKAVLVLMVAVLLAMTLAIQPTTVRAGDDPTPTPTRQGNPPQPCGSGC